MPSVDEIKAGQTAIRDLAVSLDPAQGWDQKLAVDGAVGPATVGAAQVLLYLAEKTKTAPIPDELEPLLRPGTQSAWQQTLTTHWGRFLVYIDQTLGLEKKPGLVTYLFIATMVGGAALFIAGLVGLARWEDRTNSRAAQLRGPTRRVAPGYYQGDYRGKAFELVKVEGSPNWYWRLLDGSAGGEDWYPTKRDALAAVHAWIDDPKS